MKLQQFGTTNHNVSPIGLGLAALGRPGYINLGHGEDLQHDYEVGAMTLRTHDLLDAAWNAGVRYFDAARSYGRAEQFLASWLVERAIAPADITIGSKWGYTYTADWQVNARKHEVKDHTLPTLQDQLLMSLDLLGKHLDLYQIHSATLESGVLENIGVLQELARIRDTGITIGLSLSGPRQAATLAEALKVKIGGQPLFGAVQATWNVLERSVETQLKIAHEKGLAVIVKEALANGLLTGRNNRPDFSHKMNRLGHIAAEMNTTIDAMALAFAMKQPFVTVVLSGAATMAHLNSNLQALTVAWDEAFDGELAQLREPAGHYWSRRSQLPWN